MMNLTAQTGKVIWSNNSVVTTTSGSISGSSTFGVVTNGSGVVVGGGGGGTVSTSERNVEKAKIALFEGGELNVEFNCDPLFMAGHVATIVYRNDRAVAFYNQTTDRWNYRDLNITFLWNLAVVLSLIASAYFGYKAYNDWYLVSRSFADFGLSALFFPEKWIYLFGMVIKAALAIGLPYYSIRNARRSKRNLMDAVIAIIRGQDKKYASKIEESQSRHRAMIDAI